jgi:hypothetical protein
MSRWPDVADIGSGDDLGSDIDAWTTSAPLRALVDACSEDSAGDVFGLPLGERLNALDVFSERWDTRGGKERNLAAALELTQTQEEITLDAAAALGLYRTTPPRRSAYDHLLMLGGLVRACMTRPAYAAQLLHSGGVRAGDVTALGGHRPFAGDEHDLATLAGIPECTEEFQALTAGTRLAFELGEPGTAEGESSDLVGGTWSLDTYFASTGLTVRVAAAPSSQPKIRRANTADTYDWFAQQIADLQPGQHVLAVTTAIYVPAQQAAALRMLALPYGVTVETVGMQPGDVIPALAQHFSPSHYLQEIRSTIRSVKDLFSSLPR